MFMIKQLINTTTAKEVSDYLLAIKNDINCDFEIILKLLRVKKTTLKGLRPLEFIINEICDCLVLNKQCAATTLTNYLLESSLKLSLIYWKAYEKPFDNKKDFEMMYIYEVEKYIGKEMSKILNFAFEEHLIDINDMNDLKKLMLEYRNHIDHASNNKSIRNLRIPIATLDLNTNESTENLNAKVTGNPLLYLIAQEDFMRINAYDYFMHVFSYILKWDDMLHERYNKINK